VGFLRRTKFSAACAALFFVAATSSAAEERLRFDYSDFPTEQPADGEPFYIDDSVSAPGQGPTAERVFAPPSEEPWMLQLLPEGLIYRSYLAGPKEPRFGAVLFHEREQGWLWDSTLGARIGVLRYGTLDPFKPEGWELDVEGAAFPRLNFEAERDLDSADFRAGVPLTYGLGGFEAKFAYYHISSHLGDEYLVRHPNAVRINYVRDALVLGLAFRPMLDLRIYGEAAWAFYYDGGAQPWEFQFGAEYAPIQATGFRGAPFLAVNGYLREELNYNGTLTVELGWMWRSRYNGPLLRTGFQYLNGMSPQFQFFDQFEEQFGLGLWYDF
jgi:Protein of unknown function (DUF1207)